MSNYIESLNNRISEIESCLQRMEQLEPITHQGQADLILAKQFIQSATDHMRSLVKTERDEFKKIARAENEASNI